MIQGTLVAITKLIMCVNSKELHTLEQYEITLRTLDKLLKTDFKDDGESTELIKEIFDSKIIGMLIRPYQDVQKIISFSKITGKQFITYEVVENTDRAHAELAASNYYFAKYGKNPDYAGISKLSCYLCHEILSEEHEGHRGTHGILYLKDYKLPDKYESSIEIKEFLSLKLQSYLNDTVFAKPAEHILNTFLLNRGMKLTQFLEYYKPDGQQAEPLIELLKSIPTRGDLDQFDDLSSDDGFENQILGQIKQNFEL